MGSRRTWEEVAVSHTEFNLDVDAVRISTLDERRPQPVVDVVVGDVAGDVGSPVDALFKVGKALFDPLFVYTRPVERQARKRQAKKVRK